MKTLHKILAVASPFILAATTGHLMQNAEGPEDISGRVRTISLTDAGAGALIPQVTVTGKRIGGEARLPATDTHHIPQADTGIAAIPLEEAAPPGFVTLADCPATLKADAGPRATALLTIIATCAAGKAVAVAQHGLTVQVRLDDNGTWRGTLPLLGGTQMLSLRYDGAELAETLVTAEGSDRYNRVLLSWPGDAPLALNAYEQGARYDGEGHVAPDTPRTPDTPLGGWLQSYATNGGHMQVYTAPASLTDVRLEISLPVSEKTCGRDLAARVTQVISGKTESATPLVISVPDCDGLGGAIAVDLPGIGAKGDATSLTVRN